MPINKQQSHSAPIDGNNAVVIEHVITGNTVANFISGRQQNTYNIPATNTPFLDAAFQSTLQVDLGAGLVPQVYGVDYVHAIRDVPHGADPTIVDGAIGFKFNGPVYPLGTPFRFTWKEFRLYMPPPVMLAYNTTEDYTVKWYPGIAPSSPETNPPNGVKLGPVAGLQIEWWRRTRHAGGKRGTNNPVQNIRLGRRYMPYYRGTIDQFQFTLGELRRGSGNGKHYFYKACYYDPATGARSPLTSDKLTTWGKQGRPQRNGLTAGSGRNIQTLWID